MDMKGNTMTNLKASDAEVMQWMHEVDALKHEYNKAICKERAVQKERKKLKKELDEKLKQDPRQMRIEL